MGIEPESNSYLAVRSNFSNNKMINNICISHVPVSTLSSLHMSFNPYENPNETDPIIIPILYLKTAVCYMCFPIY